MSGATVILLAKAPVAGRVKTRLCPPCTPDQAAEIATAAMLDSLAAIIATPGIRPLVALDGAPGRWLPRGVDVVPQVAGGLADRLTGAFAAAAGPAILIGMDTPQVTPSRLRHAVDALLEPGVDAVLGPTVDGGYWIIGLRAPDARVFTGIAMSTDTTGAAQRHRLDALGFVTRELATDIDVDTFADARTVAAAVPHTHFATVVARIERDLLVPTGDPT